jgi:hypothetical protein
VRAFFELCDELDDIAKRFAVLAQTDPGNGVAVPFFGTAMASSDSGKALLLVDRALALGAADSPSIDALSRRRIAVDDLEGTLEVLEKADTEFIAFRRGLILQRLGRDFYI